MSTQPAKLTQMFKVTYAYAGPGGAMRTGAKLIREKTAADAAHVARTQLAKEHDWFKVTRTVPFDGDEVQKSL